MDKILEIHFSGWTATPRMPFILSGNALCLPVPTYSILIGILGCCLGRLINAHEVRIEFQYSFDSTANDLETRHRLEFDGKRIKNHAKGTDAYSREFHTLPKLTIWIDRLDWKDYFLNPIGTPCLGRSQDLLKIDKVCELGIQQISEAEVSGCLLPFNANLKAGGQLVQLAEAFIENEIVGGGRRPTKTSMFLAIAFDNKAKVKLPHLYQTVEAIPRSFYLHSFS